MNAGAPAAITSSVTGIVWFPFAAFDAITTGFVMRNVTDIALAFREMHRVARPGAAVSAEEGVERFNRYIAQRPGQPAGPPGGVPSAPAG